MSAIGPGDLVEARYNLSMYGASVTAGMIYTVAWVGSTASICTTCGETGEGRAMGLVGVRQAMRGPIPMHWCVCEFRPINGGQKGMFDHMLKPVREDA